MSTVITGAPGHLGRLVVGLARGEWFTASDDLVKLIGRPATTAHEAVQHAPTIKESR